MLEILAFAAIETAGAVIANEMARRRRVYLLNRWARGQMSLSELEDLKHLPWFRRAFPLKEVACEKKNN